MERNDTVAWKDKYDGFRRRKQAAIKLQKEKKMEKCIRILRTDTGEQEENLLVINAHEVCRKNGMT